VDLDPDPDPAVKQGQVYCQTFEHFLAFLRKCESYQQQVGKFLCINLQKIIKFFYQNVGSCYGFGSAGPFPAGPYPEPDPISDRIQIRI
jgi:hypothetical protein